MGNTCDIFECCYKKKKENTLITSENNGLTRLSDIIENKQVEWESKEDYYKLLRDTEEIKNKFKAEKKYYRNELQDSNVI